MVSHLVNWLSPLKERLTVVTGERGAFVADTLHGDLSFHENGLVATEWDQVSSFRGVTEGDSIRFAISKPEPLRVQHENFRDAIRGDRSRHHHDARGHGHGRRGGRLPHFRARGSDDRPDRGSIGLTFRMVDAGVSTESPHAGSRETALGRWRALWARSAPPASEHTLRGVLWIAVIAVDFFYLSNPILLHPAFGESLQRVTWVTLVWSLVQLPVLRRPLLPLPVLGFLAWAALSVVWSIDPGQTLGYVLLNVQIAFLALLVCANVTAVVLARGMALGGVAVLVVSLFMVRDRLPVLDYSLSYSEYLVGIGNHRNILSYTLVLALAALACAHPVRWPARAVWLGAAGTLVAGVFLTESATGKLAVGLLCACAVVRLVRRRGRDRGVSVRRWVIGATVVAVLAFVTAALLQRGGVMSVLDRDPTTLSGRVPLWSAILHVTGDAAPVTGWGWGAVWNHVWDPARPNPIIYEIGARAREVGVHGHSSFFDLVPEIGLVGRAPGPAALPFDRRSDVARGGRRGARRGPAARGSSGLPDSGGAPGVRTDRTAAGDAVGVVHPRRRLRADCDVQACRSPVDATRSEGARQSSASASTIS